MSDSWYHRLIFYRICNSHVVCTTRKTSFYSSQLDIWSCLDSIVYPYGNFSFSHMEKKAVHAENRRCNYSHLFISVLCPSRYKRILVHRFFWYEGYSERVTHYRHFSRNDSSSDSKVFSYRPNSRTSSYPLLFLGIVRFVSQFFYLATKSYIAGIATIYLVIRFVYICIYMMAALKPFHLPLYVSNHPLYYPL